MYKRHFWLKKIESAWRQKSVVWLSGVRRSGKTVLSRSMPEIEYFDCELPRVRRMLDDPQAFLEGFGKGRRRIVLDEVHRLSNPSELLKIAADYFSHLLFLATGSSLLGISAKFRDTLAGRKREIILTPMISSDMVDFGAVDFQRRFLHGGLPPFFIARKIPEADYQEWMDAYWAKDIQELFRLGRRHSFQKFFELLMAQSGGIFEAAKFAAPCEVSRMTIANYLKVLEVTYVVTVLRPFSSHRATEIVAAPKVYAFDTGFFCYHRGWNSLRGEDKGVLWEHFVLNEILARLQTRSVLYWRDKRGHEIDFVLARRRPTVVAIECKWSADDLDSRSLKAFLAQYPKSSAYVVCFDVQRPFERRIGSTAIRFVGLEALITELSKE